MACRCAWTSRTAAGGTTTPSPRPATSWLLRGSRGAPGRWWLEGAVAVEHARAPSTAATDWRVVAGLLGALERRTGLPTYRVERALAVAEVEGPQAGLAVLASLSEEATEALARWPSLSAVEADLLERAGDADAALVAWHRALDLTDQPGMRARLAERIDALGRA